VKKPRKKQFDDSSVLMRRIGLVLLALVLLYLIFHLGSSIFRRMSTIKQSYEIEEKDSLLPGEFQHQFLHFPMKTK